MIGRKTIEILGHDLITYVGRFWVESQEFNIVHKTILGLNSLVLDDLLPNVPKSIIESGDARGKTPLWWTAYSGNYSAMLSLIRYNVDVRKLCGGWSALAIAICCGNQQCARLLLQKSPDLGCLGNSKWLELHYAAYHGLDADILKATIPSGLDVNVITRDVVRDTALMLAVQQNHPHTCEFLLSHGALPDITDVMGENALHYAIKFKSCRSIQLLIQCTNVDIKTQAGETFLHHAAQHSDVRSLEIIYAFGLRGISTEDKVTSSSLTQIPVNVVGLTAFEIAERRTDVTPEWLALFKKLLHKTNFPDDPIHMNVAVDGDEEFHDALELPEA